MSHVADIKAEIKDLDALERAARRLGGTLIRNQRTYKWWGRSVGDYPLPEGTTVDDLGKCDHAISFPGCSYEIGVCQTTAGRFTLRWDFIDGSLVNRVGGQAAPKLVQAYATEAAIGELTRKGIRYSEQSLPDGRIRLTALTR